MGYNIYLLRKEVKEQNTNFDFLENEEKITKFTEEQIQKLKTTLLSYKYEVISENQNSTDFEYRGGLSGIRALLTKSMLSFSSGFSTEGIFEISMTASEFTASGEFVKLDLQANGWEEV